MTTIQDRTTIQAIDLFLKNNNVQITTTDFVKTASNIYHKFESERYDYSHFSIELSIPHWQKVLNNLPSTQKKNLNVLDFGCGTGFVTNQIIKSKFFSDEINITCYDLSPDMIEVCQSKFSKFQNINYLSDREGFEILKNKIGKFDYIMCNALIHHILDHKELFKIFDDSLADNGILIIGHEPNKNFYKNSVLQKVSSVYRIFKRITNKIEKVSAESTPIQKDLNLMTYEELLNKEIIQANFPRQFLPKLIDIHVPMSTLHQQPWGELGFDAAFFEKEAESKFIVTEQSSYNHIKDQQAYKSFFWRFISKILEKAYPNDGADVIFILKKN
jgi:2-polyprenyl-3-methyl-5-hydroxy-6-metoxy-1,4-benzoquinol methylase